MGADSTKTDQNAFTARTMRQLLPLLTVCFAIVRSSLVTSEVLSFSFISSNRETSRFFMSAEPSTTATDNLYHQQFGKFLIAPSHVFYRSTLSVAFVNLRPIVPGHVLIVPQRVVARMESLSNEEYIDLWQSVREVQGMLKNHYKATGFNVAVQDGSAAGQSVPHVHVHILPRTDSDFERNDDIYDALEEWAPREKLSQNKPTLAVPEDEDRKDRTFEQMREEAAIYRSLL